MCHLVLEHSHVAPTPAMVTSADTIVSLVFTSPGNGTVQSQAILLPLHCQASEGPAEGKNSSTPTLHEAGYQAVPRQLVTWVSQGGDTHTDFLPPY